MNLKKSEDAVPVVHKNSPLAVVVNDDVTQSRMLSALCEKAGMRVLSYGGAEEALQSMPRSPAPDLIVSDVYMPDLDGWQFCRLLKSSDYECFNKVPVLVVSAVFAGEEAERVARDLGANAFMSAPVDARQFIAQVITLAKGKAEHQVVKVLIVEDSTVTANMLKKAFRDHGYEVVVASSAAGAADEFSKTEFEVVILDHHLPDRLGEDLMVEFRTRRPYAAYIMMTGDSDLDLSMEWLKKGASAYARKPFNPEYLVALSERARRERALIRTEDLLEERTQELRRSEALVREQREEIATFFTASLDLLCIADVDGYFRRLNPQWETTLGYSLAELENRRFTDLVHPDDVDATRDAIAQLSVPKPLLNFTNRYRHRDGSWCWLEWRSFPKGNLIYASARDITDRKRLEKSMMSLSARLHSVVSAVPDIIMEVDQRNIYTWANAEGFEFFGMDVLGKEASYFFAGDQDTYQKVQPLFEGREDLIFVESWQRRKDGQKRLLSWRCRVIRDENGEVFGTLSAATDITDARLAEVALRDSEEKYRTLVENANEAIFVAQGGAFVFANSRTAQLLGYSVKELNGMSFAGLIHPDDRAMVVDRHMRRLKGEKLPSWYEFRVVPKDGVMRWAELGAVMINWRGSPATLNFLSDITERKRIDRKLRFHAELETAVAKISSSFINLAPEDVDRGVETSLGIIAVAIGAERGSVFLFSEDLSAVTTAYEWHEATAESRKHLLQNAPSSLFGSLMDRLRRFETVVVSTPADVLEGSGESAWVKAHGFRPLLLVPMVSHGQLMGALGLYGAVGETGHWSDELAQMVPVVASVLTSVLEHKHSEHVLRESEKRYRMLFQNLSTGFALHEILLDSNGKPCDYRFLEANPTFETMTGLKVAEVIGKRVLEFLPNLDPKGIETYGKVAMTGESVRFEIHEKTLGRHYEVIAYSPQRGQFATVFQDITDRIQREKELQDKNEELKRFTYTVSHDLKSPLVTIRTFAGYLEQDFREKNVDQAEKDMGFIKGAADKMSRLLDELLELSRVGRSDRPAVDISLQNAVSDALGIVAGRIAVRGVEVDVTKEPVMFHGDRPRIVEIFQNLLDNAAKFMGDQPCPRVQIGVEKNGEEVVISVRDNGVGIDPAHRGKLFGLFEKLDASSEGTGMGLALAKRIVEVHGGRIWAESEGKGKGATFRFTLQKTRIMG